MKHKIDIMEFLAHISAGGCVMFGVYTNNLAWMAFGFFGFMLFQAYENSKINEKLSKLSGDIKE